VIRNDLSRDWKDWAKREGGGGGRKSQYRFRVHKQKHCLLFFIFPFNSFLLREGKDKQKFDRISRRKDNEKDLKIDRKEENEKRQTNASESGIFFDTKVE